jgi:hypothetical protein
MDALLRWIPLALLLAVVAVLFVMRARMRAATEEQLRVAVEAARRDALDEFLRDIRVEERSYFRETKSMFSARRHMVLQERLCFRDIPLSNWVEREMLIEEGADPRQTAKPASVFAIPAQPGEARNTMTYL